MKQEAVIAPDQLSLTLRRLVYQLLEVHGEFSDTVLVGIQPRGIYLAQRIKVLLEKELGRKVPMGNLDVAFHRDDFRRRSVPIKANTTDMPFLVEDKHVVLVDDVLFTGRTVRAALDAMNSYGRPAAVELLVLVERRHARHLPLEATYVGRSVNTSPKQTVVAEWTDTGHQADAVYIREKDPS